MANYAVFLEGEDFELLHGEGKELLGFFVTVRVEAQSDCEAKIRATNLVKSDPQLADAFKATAAKAPKIEVKIVHQLLPENKMKSTGFVFFPMKEA
jgi:hypothetical protein